MLIERHVEYEEEYFDMQSKKYEKGMLPWGFCQNVTINDFYIISFKTFFEKLMTNKTELLVYSDLIYSMVIL